MKTLKNDYDDTISMLINYRRKNPQSQKTITDSDFKEADLKSIQERTQTYTNFLQNYVEDFKSKTKSQRIMKRIFFATILFLLVGIVFASFFTLIIIAKKENANAADIATVITAIVGSISSFLVLPKVIAENLFPSKEEDKTASVFSKMFEHDINLRDLYHISDNIKNTQEDLQNKE